jgi:leader peptidase (prepilin peptidase)/N-methyltransferase
VNEMKAPILSQLPIWWGPVLAAAFGLIWGSFVNVLIYRLPRDRSVIFPPSACPACKEKIAPYDNVPILSYVFLRGRCRHCKAPVSLRYPAVELLVGAASVIAYLRHGPGLEYLVEFGFVAAMDRHRGPGGSAARRRGSFPGGGGLPSGSKDRGPGYG